MRRQAPVVPRVRLGPALAAILLLAAALAAALVPARPAARAAELDDKTRAAVDRGLGWLAPRWAPNAPDAVVAARSAKTVPTAIPALAGLAFISAGAADDPDHPYAEQLAECLAVVVSHQQDDGLFAGDAAHGPMYGHAFATLFVSQACARSKDAALKARIERAVRLIERAQNAEGGWRYRPQPLDGDVSVTTAQMMALRAADRAGVPVAPRVIDRAAAYVANLQNPDGGFRYVAGAATTDSNTARTAAATVALHAWGKGADADRARALQYLANAVQATADGLGRDSIEGHIYYQRYYLCQALWQAGGAYRDKHLPVARNTLLAMQREDGSWDGDLSPDYATAMALIALQVPEERLSLLDAAAGAPPAKL